MFRSELPLLWSQGRSLGRRRELRKREMSPVNSEALANCLMLTKNLNTVQMRSETPDLIGLAQPQKVSVRNSSSWKLAPYATAAVGLLLALKYLNVQDLLKSALEWIGNLGPWGPVIFVGLYVAATVLFIPGSVLTLGAGAVFGVARGSIYVSISATLGATAAFLVGRYLARDAIARRIEKREKFATIDRT